MFTEDFSFPHPVLGLDDDIDGEFNCEMEVERNDSEKKIRFHNIKYEITNDYIKSLVDNGEASILIKLYCSSTFKTWSIRDPGASASFELDENELCNKVDIQCYVIAINDLMNYQDTSFHTDYAGCIFSVAENDVIAVTGNMPLNILKNHEKLGLGNIFDWNTIEPDLPIHFSYNTDKIRINYPKTADGKDPFGYLFETNKWTAYNIVIVPALSGAFDILKSAEASDYADKDWYNVITSLLPKEEWLDDEPFSNAQRLLGDLPMINAFNELTKEP